MTDFYSLAMMLIGRIIAGFAVGLLSMSGKLPAPAPFPNLILTPYSPRLPIRVRPSQHPWLDRRPRPANDRRGLHRFYLGRLRQQPSRSLLILTMAFPAGLSSPPCRAPLRWYALAS